MVKLLKNKINILIITDNCILNLGGSEKHIRNILEFLPSHKYQFQVVQLTSPSKNKSHFENASSYLSITNFNYFPVPKIYSPSFFYIIYQISKLIDFNHINIVLSFHEKSDILSLLLPNRVFRISSRRDLLINPSKFLLLFRRLLVRRFDVITAPCKAILECAARSENLKGIRKVIIYNGVDLDKFNPDVPPASDVLKMKGDSIAGVVLANIKPVKGHMFLLKAFYRTVSNFPNAKIFLVGADAGSGKEIMQWIEQHSLKENVIWLGSRNDIPNILTACDFIISSSHSEGLSNALLEGIACGLPGIATDVGGNSEIIIDNKNGFLISPGDIDSFYQKLNFFYSHPELLKKFGQQSRYIAEEKFDIKKNIMLYDKLFTRAVMMN